MRDTKHHHQKIPAEVPILLLVHPSLDRSISFTFLLLVLFRILLLVDSSISLTSPKAEYVWTPYLVAIVLAQISQVFL
jgi:hypothetical protein